MDRLDLARLLTPHPTADPRRFTLDVPDGLQQGRGAWGGVATGGMIAAAQLWDPRPTMPVRTLTAQLVAPVPPGQVHIVVEELRRGAATTTIAARVLDTSGGLLAHGVVVLGAARRGPGMPDGQGWLSVTAPAELAAGPEAVAAVPIGPPLAPDFTAQLEYRPVLGLPFAGLHTDVTSGWVRPRGPVSAMNAAVVAALADAWWVAVLVPFIDPRPAATVGFTLDLPGDPSDVPRDPAGLVEPLFHRGRTIAARDGYCVEVRELWTRAGQLISWNTQTVAVIA